ncbi:MAG: C39 family peptidase [Nitrospira sp.]|nr:C39 family peptidase [Nitrospira sp.]
MTRRRGLGTAWVGAWLLTVAGPILPSHAGILPLGPDGSRPVSHVQSMYEIRQHGVVRQKWDLSCGAAALSTLLTGYHRDPTPESAIVVFILNRTDPIRVRARGGFSLLDLKRFSQSRGYRVTGYGGLTLDELAGLDRPAIVPVRIKGYDHFVVFRARVADRVLVADPAFGNLTLSVTRFEEIWKNGIGLIMDRPGDRPEPEAEILRRREWLIPNGTAVTRFIRGGGPLSVTRGGFVP